MAPELEGLLHTAAGSSVAAVVLHPHPQMGGNMTSHVVVAACAALQQMGVSSLRFNFRGAGRSTGSFDSELMPDQPTATASDSDRLTRPRRG